VAQYSQTNFAIPRTRCPTSNNCSPRTFTDDGEKPSLTVATSAGKVLMHCPHEHNAKSGQHSVRFLNINRKITAMTSGALDPKVSNDILMIGTQVGECVYACARMWLSVAVCMYCICASVNQTYLLPLSFPHISSTRVCMMCVCVFHPQTTLLAYNVEKNSDIFFKAVPDGINKMIFGMIPGIEAPLAVVGGNCSIQGFDAAGQELFWTVTGDNVSALAFCDADGDGENELLVGSDDYSIRIFQQVSVGVAGRGGVNRLGWQPGESKDWEESKGSCWG